MNVQIDKHSVTYDPDTATISCSGFLDLRGKDGYKNIASLLDMVVSQTPVPETIILDIRELEFLNSSGITTLGGFVIKLRNKGGIRLIVKCSEEYSWQAKSIKGLSKLMPNSIEINYE